MATTDSAKAIALLVLCVQASASTAGASDVTAIVESRYTKLGCTSVVIGPKATVDGSVIATHNADCLNCDFRIARTPAMTHDAGNLKSVLKYKPDYPHWVTDERSSVWSTGSLDSELPQSQMDWSLPQYAKSLVVGYTPEVPSTYAVVEGLFGIMNEVGVGIGESTCGSVWFGKPPRACPTCDGPLVDVSFLTVIALERCATARCAITTMGTLAQEFGYYAADVSNPEGGEALSVVDAQEAWMFHILPDQAGSGAVWVAQKVPDSHVSVVANSFVIRNVPTRTQGAAAGNASSSSSSASSAATAEFDAKFLASDNLWSAAEAAGLWSPDSGEELDFTAVYGFKDFMSAYSTRRQWRILSLAQGLTSSAPPLPADVDWMGNGLPFSIEVGSLVSVSDVMAWKRDFYEGTPFDLSQGPAAGPYGDPRRFDASANTAYNENNMTLHDIYTGGFERSISMFRTSYSSIAVSRATSPANALTRAVVWVAQYAPHMSVYTPIYVASGPAAVPSPLSIGNLFRYDPKSTFWQACSVGNWAAQAFKYAIVDVRAAQQALEQRVLSEQSAAEAQADFALSSGDATGASDALTSLSAQHCQRFVDAYANLFTTLIAKYHDGMSLEDPTAPSINVRRLFYPKWWLKTVGGFWSAYDYPPDDTSDLVNNNNNPQVATLGSEEHPGTTSSSSSRSYGYGSSLLYSFLSYTTVALMAGAVGLHLGKQQQQQQRPQQQHSNHPNKGGPGVELSSLSRAAALALHTTSPNRRGYEAI